MTRKESEELTGMALFASLLGNIAQASKNKDLQKKENELVTLLTEWRQAAERSNAQLHDLRRAYEAQSQAYKTLATQYDELQRERDGLHVRYVKALEELNDLRGRRPRADPP